jgi:hypothetical protein
MPRTGSSTAGMARTLATPRGSAVHRELRQPRTRADGEARHGEQPEPLRARADTRLIGYGRQIHGRAGRAGRTGTGCSARRGFEGHGCCPRCRLVPMIGYARPLLAWWVQEARGQFRDGWELPRRRRRAGSVDLLASSACACRKTRPTFRTGREHPPTAFTAVSASLLRGQVLED